MQLEKFQKLIALYALDILNESERRQVEEAISTSPALQAQLAEFQSAVDAIAYSASPVPMAANLKDRLFDRINS
jgi:anti-sigma factor RsiW